MPISIPIAGTLRIQNGANNGANRVSGAIIQLNSTVLSTARTLNLSAATLDLPVTFAAANSLSVRIVGAPGSYLTISALLLTPLAITSLVPSTGPTGTSLMINGTGFDPRTPNHNLVSFTRAGGGLTPAQVTAFSATQLTAVVPADAATGPVMVQNNAGTAISPMDFTVVSPVTIVDFNPKRGPENTLVTITGLSLKPDAATPMVTFTGNNDTRLPAIVTSATNTQVQANVPAGAITGPIGISNSFGSTLTVPIYRVETPQDFQITLAPAAGIAVQGSAANYVVSLTSNQTTFSQLATLSVTGLPAGITASFTPQQISAGASSTLTLVVPGNVAASTYNFTVSAKAAIEGTDQTRTANGSLAVQQGGQTSLAGRVLSTQDEPIMGATVSLDGKTATTDAAGNFLLSGITAGTSRPVMVDGRTANAPNRTYPVIAEPVNVVANQINVVPYTFYLPAIDTASEVTVVPNQVTTVTTSKVPGLSLTIPANAGLTNRDGTPVTRASLTSVEIDRTPAPLPANVGTSIVYTAQPGGAKPAPGKVMPVIYPNLGGANPGTRIELWNFNHDTVQWYIYGYGNVSPDGRTIVPEAGVGLPDFSWSFPNIPSNCDGDCPDKCPTPITGDPVELSSGMKIEEMTDVSWSGARGGLTLTRTHTTLLAATCVNCPFGRGWTHSYAYRLTGSFNEGGAGRFFTPIETTGRLFSYLSKEADNTLVFTTTATPGQLGDVIRKLPNGTYEYRYKNGDLLRFNATGRLTAMVDRNGNTTTLQYTGANLTSITDPVGRSLTLGYSNGSITQVTDPLNRIWQYTYNGSNLLTTASDPLRQVTQYSYDGFGRLTSITDKRGIVAKQITYNSGGRVSQQQFPDGGIVTITYTLSGNSVTGATITDPIGRTKSMRFNGAGQVVGTTDGLGQNATIKRDLTTNLALERSGPCGCREEKSVFDSRGNPTEITDRLNQTTHYEYDSVFSNVTQITDRLGRVTTYTYDAHGNLTSMTNALNQTTTYTYDQFGQRTSVTDPLGHTRQMEYDAGGNITGMIDALNHHSSMEYDVIGRMIAIVDPLGRRSERTYDVLDRMRMSKDPSNAVTRFDYDANGNLIGLTNALNQKWTTKFDLENRPATTIDPLNRVTQMFFDKAGQLRNMIKPSKRRTRFSYDGRGQKTSETDGLGSIIRYNYDNRGNLAAISDQRNNTTTFVYDELFRNSSQVDPLGHKADFSYDAEGNMISIIDRLGRKTNITFDAMNRRANVVYIDATLAYNYDASGRTISITDTQGGAILMTYDNADRLLSEQTPQGLVSYTYNNANDRASLTVANQPVVTYNYDSGGRLSAITQNNTTFNYNYDTLSRLQSLLRPNGVTTSYQYNAVNRLTRMTHTGPLIVIEDLQYSYDADDEIETINSLSSATLLSSAKNAGTANAANRISQFGQSGYSFNDEGQPIAKMDALGTTHYIWDARGRLTNVTLPNGQVTNYNYDALGRRQSRGAGGITTSFIYDDQNIVRDVVGGSGMVDYLNGPGLDQKLQQTDASGAIFFLSDHLGSTIALANAQGSIVERRQSEAFGEGTFSSLSRYGFAGREQEAEIGLYFYRARYYEPESGRFISEDPIQFSGGSNFYAYVGNNPLNYTDPLGLICCPTEESDAEKKQYKAIAACVAAGLGLGGALFGPPPAKIPAAIGGIGSLVGCVLLTQEYSEALTVLNECKKKCVSCPYPPTGGPPPGAGYQ